MISDRDFQKDEKYIRGLEDEIKWLEDTLFKMCYNNNYYNQEFENICKEEEEIYKWFSRELRKRRIRGDV